MEQITTFKEAVKLVALYQATLEQLMNQLERSIEQTIRGPLSALDETDEELMSTIQYKVEAILDLSLEELAGLKMAIEEHRTKEK